MNETLEMTVEKLKDHNLELIVEAVLFAAGKPMQPVKIATLFAEERRPSEKDILQVLQQIRTRYANRGIELQEVASGYRFQICSAMMPWVNGLWEEKEPRYTRALLETLALIAYRQPITRGEIEEVRGVAISSNIMRTLQEREWVRIVGHREVPGRPALYATTRQFLDHFNLKNLDELPPLAEIHDISSSKSDLQANIEQDLQKKSFNHEVAKNFREDAEKADQVLFATVDELLAKVKTDFSDLEPENNKNDESNSE